MRIPEFEHGVADLAARRIPMALKRFNEAERLGHPSDECAAHRWYCWMLLGDFERAWCESDAIHRRGAPDPNRLWDQCPFDNQRVIIRCLHGFGDAIQFLRYAPQVRARASRVIVETHPEMVTLLAHMPGIDHVITWADGSFDLWDRQIEVMELPYIFRTTLPTIPRAIPYLNLSAADREQSRRNLPVSRQPRVGVLWGSSGWNPARSVPFSDFNRILCNPGFSFFSFQRGPARDDLTRAYPAPPCHDTADLSPTILHTAADLTHMDLLITVDTMAAHLAGALGIRAWTLIPYAADWRWMLDRLDTPWYPAMRLFRQPEPGNWNAVIDAVIHALTATA